jgi:hypothetical protein
MLCIGCLEKRLERRLEPSDFLGIPMNHMPNRSARLRSRVLGTDDASERRDGIDARADRGESRDA